MGSSCIVCKSFSDNEATASVASLIFLKWWVVMAIWVEKQISPLRAVRFGRDDTSLVWIPGELFVQPRGRVMRVQLRAIQPR
jgi:hypothetical protein